MTFQIAWPASTASVAHPLMAMPEMVNSSPIQMTAVWTTLMMSAKPCIIVLARPPLL